MSARHSRTTYAIVVLAALAILALALLSDKVELKDIGTGLLAMLGTLLGATLAFRLNEDKEHAKEHARRRAALNRALFTLARQKNAVALIARELAPYQTDFDRAFNFPAAKVPPYADLVQRIDDLEFLVEVSDVNVLLKLTVEEERFHQLLESLRVRNEFYVRELQPEISRHKLNGRSVSSEQALGLLGDRLLGSALNYAKILWSHAASSEASLPERIAELRGVAKQLYPGHKFIGLSGGT